MNRSILFFSLMALSFLTSCNRGDDLTFTEPKFECYFNGTFMECTPEYIYASGQDIGLYLITTTGYIEPSITYPVDLMGLNVFMGNDYTLGTYESEDSCENDPTCVVISFVFYDDLGNEIFFSSGEADNTAAKVTFDEFIFEDESIVRGSFSGTVINEETGEVATVTNGIIEVKLEL